MNKMFCAKAALLVMAFSLQYFNIDSVDNKTNISFGSTVEAAKPKLKKLSKAEIRKREIATYEHFQKENQGVMAEEKKMVLTTEQALSFTFAGFTKPEAVEAVLDRLNKLGIYGSFYVGEKDIQRNPKLIQRIIDEGHEVGIALYPMLGATFASECRDIDVTRKLLEKEFGVKTNYVKQPWGVINDFSKEAVHAMGCELITQNINATQAKHKAYTDPNQVVSELFGKYVYSVGRGWIVNFRMDYYDDPKLCADIVQVLKEKKVDNIAYWEFNDDPGKNKQNDSAYTIKTVAELLANKDKCYTLPATNIPERLQPKYNRMKALGEPFSDYVKKRYIGSKEVKTLDISAAEVRKTDVKGLLHTDDPVIFLGFDDWGTDASINPILYVLRKHNIKADFFILTNNVRHNPNLLRAIAEEGHDIGCHTNTHKPMVVRGPHNVNKAVENKEETYADYGTAYEILASLIGDVEYEGRHVLTRYFRPPTLTISKIGLRALYDTGYEHIVSGASSTKDYRADNLYNCIDEIRGRLYKDGKVLKGTAFVIHMSDVAKYTARALDIILTENEARPEGDAKKFKVALLSEYLVDGYDQSKKLASKKLTTKMQNK